MFSKFKKRRVGSSSGAENPSQPEQDIATAQETASLAASAPVGFEMEREGILIDQKLENRADVLSLIARKMLQLGYVAKDYTQALEAREASVSTYLANGIAIPHGVNEAKSLVIKTGIVIVQLPNGVIWNDKGDRVHLAVGIAAAGSEHIELLQKLTGIVMDKALASQLGTSANADTIAAALNQSLPPEIPETSNQSFDATATARIVDAAGLHARPATLLVQMAEGFQSTELWIGKGDLRVSLDSMTRLLSLGAVCGDLVEISACGPDARKAVDHIAKAMAEGLDPVEETSKANSDYQPLEDLIALDDPKGRALLKGIPASPGIAMANAFILDSASEFHIEKSGSGVAGERSALDAALLKANGQLRGVSEELATRSPQEASIFLAQAELLRDREILSEAHAQIEKGDSAAWAWQQTIDRQATVLEDNVAERIRARAADLRDIGRRVVAILQGGSTELRWPDEPFILIARELTPSQTAELGKKPVRAICTELGGATSHMAILARALGLPALVGLGSSLLTSVRTGERVAVDPQSEQVILDPDADTMAQVEACIQQWQLVQAREFASKDEPAITKDGIEIEVVCNIASVQDARKVAENGGAGVGLLRTEFLFETADKEPSVEDQAKELSAIADLLGSHPLIVRTSDIGGDKPVGWLKQSKEDNPFLGVRGIRLSLRHPEIFKRQLEAIYRVAKVQVSDLGKTGIHIMFPMISSLAEWRKAKALADEVRLALDAPVIPLGMMIEVPSAALMAEHFAKEADFFSVGTNDLTQYTLAMDRMNPDLLAPNDNYSPALLKMLAMTTRAATAEGKWVGVCGNLVAEPDFAKILIGLGVKELSVSPVNVPAVKELVRSIDRKDLEIVVERALEAATPEEVRHIIREA
ncbi:phosphoenolpyruvate--protein phosphotransferase [uncultured Cohaesibacter sp.]|uniref:phosphoenolpyruvate--protein phosphotransferase n=1 Tax=uncultured Cohaesibacter sp. TaxID=1002546 RepID=UPI00292D126D|nr:phosphoenolpyruvate--protein phosphotransferase [uncultured Cohaesibacter sp.]